MVNPDLRASSCSKQYGLSQQCRSSNKKKVWYVVFTFTEIANLHLGHRFLKNIKKSHHNASETPKSVSAVDCLDSVRVSASPNL